jgi:spermidine synthase
MPSSRTLVPRLAFAVLGFATLTIQALLLRELMVAWRGNEMSFGITLSTWLISAAAGSAIASRMPGLDRAGRGTLAAAFAMLAVLSPVAILLSRMGGRLVGIAPGELTGLQPLVLGAIVSVAPFTLLSGFMFALSAAVASRERAPARRDCLGSAFLAAELVGDVYIYEALGALVAGALLSFILLRSVDTLNIALLSGLLCSLAGLSLVLTGVSRPRLREMVAPVVVLVLSALALAGPGGRLDRATVAAQWRELGFVTTSDSIYGRIVTTRTGTQSSIYENGLLVASSPNRLAAEEAVHLAMIEHPSPRSVLLLGGGLGGSIAEILKHPAVLTLDYVELDPHLIREAIAVDGRALTTGLNDTRVSTVFTDARLFVKQLSSGTYDVVIVNVPDPTTAFLNRFYTEEFFREVSVALSPGGLVAISATSSENYVGDELARFLECVRRTMSEVFDSVVLFPGDPCHILATMDGNLITRDAVEISRRVDERRLDVVHFRDYYLRDRLRPERIASLEDAVQRADAPINHDLAPAGYLLSLVLWNRHFGSTPRIFSSAAAVFTLKNAFAVGALALALTLAPAALVRLRRRRFTRAATAGDQADDLAWIAFRSAVVLAIIVVGFTEMSLEIGAIIAFQSLYGYVYRDLALITAAFMGGLATGGWAGSRMARRRTDLSPFVVLQAGICFLPLLFASAVRAISELPPESLVDWAAFFPIVVVASALLAGAQFPMAAAIYASRRSPGRPGAGSIRVTGGRLYAADLFGAALGATAAAVFLLPVMGLQEAMKALGVLNSFALLALLIPLPTLLKQEFASRSRKGPARMARP